MHKATSRLLNGTEAFVPLPDVLEAVIGHQDSTEPGNGFSKIKKGIKLDNQAPLT